MANININDVLTTLNRIKSLLDRLRRREAGVVESEGTGFPYTVNLNNFRSTDEIAVVTSVPGGRVRPPTSSSSASRRPARGTTGRSRSDSVIVARSRRSEPDSMSATSFLSSPGLRRSRSKVQASAVAVVS